jgi:2'-5' RNA ligase
MLASRGLELRMAGPQQRLFFALRPPPEAVAAIGAVAERLRGALRIDGKWTKPEKYHVTLNFLGTHPSVPQSLIDAATQAASEFAFAAFTLTLDRAWRFRGRGQSPCILLADAASENVLRDFCNALGARLHAHAAPFESAREFTPHLTLAYGDWHAPTPLPIEPIRWPARDFVLLRSDVGSGRHEQLAIWPLHG